MIFIIFSVAIAIYLVEKLRGNIRIFRTQGKPELYLSLENNKVSGAKKAGLQCEFKLKVQPDRSVAIESVKSPNQMLTFVQSGRPHDPRGAGLGPQKLFYCYVKVSSATSNYCTEPSFSYHLYQRNSLNRTADVSFTS